MAQVLAELQVANAGRGYPISLNDTDVRTLAGVPSGAISMSNLYGKSAARPVNFGFNLTNVAASKAIRGVTFRINSDGSITSQGTGNGPTSSWYAPNVANIGTGYWCRFTSNGQGTFLGQTKGSIVNIGTTGCSITVNSTSTTADNTGQIACLIYTDAAAANLVCSGTFTYEVGWSGL